MDVIGHDYKLVQQIFLRTPIMRESVDEQTGDTLTLE
jgi:hypothetical protein